MPKMNVKKGDQVEILSGKDKGARGEVLRAIPDRGKVVVEGVAGDYTNLRALPRETRVPVPDRKSVV